MGFWAKTLALKGAALVGASLAFLGGIGSAINQPTVMQSAPPQAAFVAHIALSESVVAKPAVPEEVVVPIKAGLLPTVKINAHLAASKTPSKASDAETASTVAAPNSTDQESLVPEIPPSQPQVQIPLTTQAFLDATTLSLAERLDGFYEVRLSTNAGVNAVAWDFTSAKVTGAGGIVYDASYACNPEPTPAVTEDTDQNPIFAPRTNYTCTISLTPESGDDLRQQSKQFSFTTPAGQLSATPPESMDTTLKNNENDGGFVFTNDDTQQVTVTGLTFNVAYTALTTVYGPLVLRVIDPSTEKSVGDYHLENAALDAGSQYTHTIDAITVPVDIAIPARGEKMIPVDLFGVDAMEVLGENPNVTVTLTGVATNPNNTNTTLNSAVISWNCIVTNQIYDPNATSGPLVSGQACNVGGN